MDDLINSMKAHLYDRVSSPLVFSFACSWTLWNYRLILILIGDGKPDEKFAMIDALPGKSKVFSIFGYHLDPNFYWLVSGLIAPLLTTLFYIVILPAFEAQAYSFSARKTRLLKIIKMKSERETPESRQEVIRLRELVRQSEKRLDEESEKQRTLRANEIEELKKQVRDAAQTVHDSSVRHKQEVEGLKNELKETRRMVEAHEEEAAANEKLAARAFRLTDIAREMLRHIVDEKQLDINAFSEGSDEIKDALKELENAYLVELRTSKIEPTAEGIKLTRPESAPTTGLLSIFGNTQSS